MPCKTKKPKKHWMPKTYTHEGKKYYLWDIQYSEPNARFSQALIAERISRSKPVILVFERKVKGKFNELAFGVYVLHAMKRK